MFYNIIVKYNTGGHVESSISPCVFVLTYSDNVDKFRLS